MTSTKKISQYGLWSSPLTPVSLARGMAFGDVAWDENGSLVWLERRSDRGVLVIQPFDGQADRDLNSDLSVRARVGYGGGDFTVGHGAVFFAEANSGRLYRQELAGGLPRPVTPGFGFAAAPALSPDGRYLVYVHTYEGQDVLAIVDAEGKSWPQILVSSADFFMQPVWHPDGNQLAWISWDHPNMPWDGTSLWLGTLSEDTGQSLPSLKEAVKLAGDENISIFQPAFSPNGCFLTYVSDETGWWQIVLHDLGSGERRQLTRANAEHGAPAWNQGLRTYGFSPDGQRLFFIRNQQSQNSLWQVDITAGYQRRLILPEEYTGLDQLAVFPCDDPGEPQKLAFLASGGVQTPRVIEITVPARADAAPGTPVEVQIWRRATAEELPAEAYSRPESLDWESLDGGAAYGLFYPPHNLEFEGTGLPPLLVHIHGGPTSQRRDVFNPQAQFLATRGIAYLEVNYRGSTGFGREYRNKLRGNWGIYDVQDAVSGARALVNMERVDGSKLVIMGGSAGGFTVLKALEDYPGFFKAGICLYGVSNQFTLAAETHKFEARYSDSLLGPLPEAAKIYRARSPIYFVDRIQDPLAVFHGDNDNVVPRSQSDELVASLRRRNIPHIYHVYPGEGHGFRKTETIEHFYKTVEQFLKEYVVFA